MGASSGGKKTERRQSQQMETLGKCGPQKYALLNPLMSQGVFTRAPGPESESESGSESTRERQSESGFESSLPPCKRNQSGSGSGSESLCKRG